MTPFITTYTGRKVNPLDLKPEDICVRDIAHHLAILNRFLGALLEPVSIAQHSVYVTRLMRGTSWQKEALFHDATEAYLGDVTKWLKKHETMAAYREAEDRAWLVIAEALGLDPLVTPEQNPELDYADSLMVRYEALIGFDKECHMFELPSHPKPRHEEILLVGSWRPWSWQDSEEIFLREAKSLGFAI